MLLRLDFVCLLLFVLVIDQTHSFSTKPAQKIHKYKDVDALGDALCNAVINSYEQAVKDRGSFVFSIPGGSILNMLARLEGKSSIDWSKCKMAYVNHRCVPLDDETSTHFKAQGLFLKSWQDQGLDVIKLSGSTDAEQEANLYTQALATLPEQNNGLPVFDLSLIGVGLDGHVGSLYPGTPALTDSRNVIPVVKPSSSSITLSLPVMMASRDIVIATGGTSKKYPEGKSEGMFRAIAKPDETIDSFPAIAFREKGTWLLDEAAGALV